MAQSRWWSVSWKRVGMAVLLGFVGFWVLSLLALHVEVWYMAAHAGTDGPSDYLVPEQLPNTGLADLKNGLTISRFGYAFQVPWTKINSSEDYKIAASVHFDDGSGLLVANPANYLDMLGDQAATREAFRPLIGDKATQSHYDYLQSDLEATPRDASLFGSRRANSQTYMLMTMRSVTIPEGTTAIYKIASAHLRGFQFGNPAKEPKIIKLVLFDEQDRPLELSFRRPKDATRSVLTQEQINSIVASIRESDSGCVANAGCR